MGSKKKKRPERAKGPKGFPFIGDLMRAKRDPLQFVMDLTRNYGDVAHYRIGIYTGYLLNHPDHFKRVLQDNYHNYSKQNYNYKMIKPLLGEGLITADHAKWSKQRKLIQPIFHGKRIAGFGGIITGIAHQMLKDWETKASHDLTVPISSAMMELTLRVITQSLFSTDIRSSGKDLRRAFTTINEDISDRFKTVFVLPFWVPTRRNLRFKKALKELDDLVYHIIEERRKVKSQYNDLLDMLLTARERSDGYNITNRQVRDEVMTLLLAGHETTANLLTWTCYLLSRHPQVMEKVCLEFDDVLQGRDPTVEDLPALKYMKMVLQESLRMYPPVWIISRKAVQNDEIGGYEIPAGSTVTLCSYAIHRHPEFWEDPEKFRPERFSGDQSSPAYFPFGFGPRSCIGGHFAMMEAKLILSMIFRRYHLELVNESPVKPDPLITLRPSSELNMKLVER